MYFDVIIAGAGPGGIATALTLARRNPDLSVLLVESGRPYRNRPCPVDRGRSCTGCSGICNVVEGFGGCMHYGDGVKLSLLPSGRRLIDLFGPDDADELCARSFDLFAELAGRRPALRGLNLPVATVNTFRENELAIREYPVAILSETDLATTIANAHEQVTRSASLMERTELRDLHEVGELYRLDLGAHGEVWCRSVVLATGRKGVTATSSLARKVGASTEAPDISLGVRFEMRADLLQAIGVEHPDLKISHRTAGANKTKTFCFCGGPNGGRIKFTNYQHAFGDPVITLDGHETTERVPGDRPLAANFGLLCQLTRGGAEDTRRKLLDRYREISTGRPMVQSLAAFRERRFDECTWDALRLRTSFEPSVVDLVGARVDMLFEPAEHEALVRGFTETFTAILRHQGSMETVDSLARDILVIGPEIEFLWDRIQVAADCRIPGSRVFVVGDSAGIAQGIIQATMMGIRVAEVIAASEIPRSALVPHGVGQAAR